jgi:CTP:molybdopterin cytidylyltransferase MocA
MIIRAMRVVAVVLAAGEGRRMGGPKALLRLGGRSFLEVCLAGLERAGVAERVVVLGHRAGEVRALLPAPAAVRVVVNERYREGMFSSVIAGLDAAEALGAEAMLLHPVDHPLLEPETVDRVLEALAAGAPIAVPSHQGRRGHPAGFARAAWAALRAAPPGQGARAVLAGHPQWITHVAGGAGSLRGVNTPEDLAALERDTRSG